MEWQEISQELLESNISIGWGGVAFYVLGLLTWGRCGTRKVTEKWVAPTDADQRVMNFLFSMVLWISSPFWVLFTVLVVQPVEKALKLKSIKKDKD